jgi:hypothetical protein
MMTARTNASMGEEGYFAASGPSTMSPTESDVTVLTPDATTVAQNFSVSDLQSAPGDNTRVYVLRVNGSDTALACSIVRLPQLYRLVGCGCDPARQPGDNPSSHFDRHWWRGWRHRRPCGLAGDNTLNELGRIFADH